MYTWTVSLLYPHDLAFTDLLRVQSQIFLILRLIPPLLRYPIANLARHHQDMVAMPTMIGLSLQMVSPLRLLAPLDQVDETLMRLFVSNVEKVSNCGTLISNFNPLYRRSLCEPLPKSKRSGEPWRYGSCIPAKV